MKYYHILISEKEEKNKTVIHIDLKESELKKTFVTQFLNEENILFGDRIIRHSNIEGVTIVKTNEPFHEVISKEREIQRKQRKEFIEKGIIGFRSVRDYDIEKLGENVTSVFISKAPKKKEHLFKRVTHNPLFNTCVSLIVGGVVTYYFTGC